MMFRPAPIPQKRKVKTCEMCQESFVSSVPNQKRCEVCARTRRREILRGYAERFKMRNPDYRKKGEARQS